MIRKLMFRLLPVQVILAAVSTVNMIVSSYFASNYVGTEAMSAVGLYGPLNMFFGAVAVMLVGGSSILCGEYLGQNRQDKLQEVYSLDLLLSAMAGLLFAVLVIFLAIFDPQQPVRVISVHRKQRAHNSTGGARFHNC